MNKGINHPSKIDNWKTFVKNNPTIALNILYIKEKEICSAYISNINSNCEKKQKKKTINDSKWRKRGLAWPGSKKLSTLLRGITSKNHGYFCFNCLHSFRTENKLKSHKNVYKNKDFCEIAMPSEKNNTLEFNQSIKSDKMPYIMLTSSVRLQK